MFKARFVRSSICYIAFALMFMPALLARAGDYGALTNASLSLYCNGGYCLTVDATDLPVGDYYTIDYSFTVTCSSGQSIPVSSSYTFKATAYTETVPITGNLGTTLSGSCDVSNGKATITSTGSTVYFSGSVTCPTTPPPLKLTCPPATTGQVGVPYDSCVVASGGVPPYSYNIASGSFPPGLGGSKITGCITGTPTTAGTFTDVFSVTDSTGTTAFSPSCPITITPSVPTACTIPPIDSAISGAPVSWNAFNVPAADASTTVVWVHAHISGATNVPTNATTTVDFTGVTLVVNATTYALPNGQILFVPGTTTPTTVVNADGSWTTTVSPTFNNDIFFVGQAIPVDANLEDGGKSTFNFTTNSSDSSLSFSWQWSAAVYTSWPGDAAANIEPVHGALQAGAPQNTAVQKDLIQGPRGGGGSNFTGSWSGTGHGICPQ